MKRMGDHDEAELDALLRARDLDAVATRAFTVYGPELHGFLIHLMGGESDAAEVFSQVAEDFWRGLPTFGARCSLRTWMYLLARHAASRFRRSPWRRATGGSSRMDGLVAGARSRTQPWQRTDVKDKWRALRESLDADDRTLLVLRVDRDLDWNDIARVMLSRDDVDEAELGRESARLRKRFHLLKEELRERARAAGLVAEESD
jgi:RNA polymerase sigma-70 factor, ECF subfamily